MTPVSSEFAIRAADNQSARTLTVAGPLRLPHVESLRRALLENLEAGRATVLDLSGVTAVDLCGLQMLCSAHRTFQARGLALETVGAPAGFRASAHTAGFETRHSTCQMAQRELCLWRG